MAGSREQQEESSCAACDIGVGVPSLSLGLGLAFAFGCFGKSLPSLHAPFPSSAADRKESNIFD